MATARTIWIARHGDRIDFADPSWTNAARRPFDPPLSGLGREQAAAVGDRLLRDTTIDHLFSSPFLRTMETAEPVAKRLEVPIKVERGLSEWLNRDWFASSPRLFTRAELSRRFPRIDRSYRSRGRALFGETGEQALRRSARTAIRLAEEFAGILLIVGHGASVLGATAGLLGIHPLDSAESLLHGLPYASLTRLDLRDRKWRLQIAASTRHLRGLPSRHPR